MMILHVAPISSDKRITGMFHSVPRLVRALSEDGTDVALLTTGRSPFDHPQPFPVAHAAEVGRLPSLRGCPSPLDEPDLVAFHSTYLPRQAILARECSRRGIPYLITPRGGMTRGAQSQKRLKKWLGNWLFFARMVRGAAAIHCLTEAEAQDTREWGRPVFVVGNGVDLPPDGAVAHPGSRDAIRLLFVGRLDPNHKGLDLLLEAFRLARGDLRAENVRLTIHGPSVNGSAALLRDIAEDYQLSDAVYIEGPVVGKAKAVAFGSADVFVHTSRFEGHPMAVLEALSYGLPCFLTPGTTMADEVADAGAGWRAEGTAESVASTLLEIIHSRSLLRRMGQRARMLAESRYTWERVARRLHRHYVEIINADERGS